MAFAVFPHQDQPELPGSILEEWKLFGDLCYGFCVCTSVHCGVEFFSVISLFEAQTDA